MFAFVRHWSPTYKSTTFIITSTVRPRRRRKPANATIEEQVPFTGIATRASSTHAHSPFMAEHMTTPQDWDPRTCNERSGFLFQHDCSSLPDVTCSQCQKPICTRHTHYVDNEPFCTGCAKQDLRQQRQETQHRRRRHDADYEDPYFYGDEYYRGYGRYRQGYWGYKHFSTWGMHDHDHGDMHDFTSADGASMMHEGDGDFEMDMSES